LIVSTFLSTMDRFIFQDLQRTHGTTGSGKELKEGIRTMLRLKTTRSIFLLASLLLFSPPMVFPISVHAGVNVWTSFGPEGGPVYSLAIDPSNPSTLYAGGRGDVFKSTDGGEHWNPTNAGHANDYVNALAIDPLHPNTLYVGSDGSGVSKSTDGGMHWSTMNTGLTSPYIETLVIDPLNPDTLYVGTNLTALGGGVFKSTDGGAHWSSMNTGLADYWIKSLAIDPLNPNILYAGVWHGVFKSTDGGAHWDAMDIGLPDPPGVVVVAIDPLNPTTVYATTCSSETLVNGLFKSTDGGAHWNRIAAFGSINPYIPALAIDPLNPNVLYAGTDGVFKSTDEGAHWSAMSTGLTGMNIQALAINPLNPSILYASGWDGVYKSADGGAHWTAANTGLTNMSVLALGIDPSDSNNLYLGTFGFGMFKSTDGGTYWSDMHTGVIVSAFAIDPLNPETVYAGTWVAGVFKSADGGAYWSAMNDGIPHLESTYFYSLVMDPSTPDTVYGATNGDGDGDGSGVFRSTDGGAHWHALNTGLTEIGAFCLVIDPLDPDTLYTGTSGLGVMKTVNGGRSWEFINTGLIETQINSLAIDPTNPNILYAGTEWDGIFKSTDGGDHWSPVNTGLTSSNVSVVVLNPLDPDILYAGTARGVFKSTDGGAHWHTMNTGLTDPFVSAMVLDPSNPNILYAVISGGTSSSKISRETIGSVRKMSATGGGTLFRYEDLDEGPRISISPKSIEFGDVPAGGFSERAITIKNLGKSDLAIGSILSPSSPFSTAGDTCSGLTLARGGTCAVVYRFSPELGGIFSSESTIPSNDPDVNLVNLVLNGSGIGITLQAPAESETFNSSSLIDTYQPSFEWTATGTFTGFTILFSVSHTDFGKPISKANVKSVSNRWTPPTSIWKKVMTSSNNNGAVRDIYWKVIGTKPDKTTIESEVKSLRAMDVRAAVVDAPVDSAILDGNVPPTFTFQTGGNVKFLLEFSPSLSFSNPKPIKGFTVTVKDPNLTATISNASSPASWKSVKKLIGTGTGYFRIRAWDGIKRETISEVREFTIQ
jgi:photosystem II stability/assembly factor-like uncharacterized protein